MIRKTIIVALILATLSLIVLSIVTVVTPLFVFHTTYSSLHYEILPWTVRWDRIFPYPFVDWSQVDHEALQCNDGLCECTVIHRVSDVAETTPGRMTFGGFFLGMTYGVRRSGSGPFFRYCTVNISLLIPVLLTGAYPIFVFIRGPLRRYRRRRRGLCLTCGYDLEGNLSGVCPECGTVIGEVPAAALPNESPR